MSKRDEPMSPEARQALVDMFRRHNRVAQQCYRALRRDARLRAASADERVLPDRVTQHTN